LEDGSDYIISTLEETDKHLSGGVWLLDTEALAGLEISLEYQGEYDSN